MKQTSDEICVRMKTELAAFRFLSNADLPVIAPYFDCYQVQEGEVLWQEGDPCDFLAFILEGRLDIKKNTEFAGKDVIVGVYSTGTIVGELGILDGSPRAVTAVALEDCSLLTLNRENFEKLLMEHPHLGVNLLKGMLFAVSSRLKKSYERLASIF